MKKILITGGDARMKILYDELLNHGFTVETSGLFEGDRALPNNTFDAVILPVPSTRDGITVYCPLTNKEIPLDVFNNLSDNVLLLTGAYKPKRENFIDYCSLDDYSILNAVPTAEGAIAEAIRRTDFTLWKSRVLVIGHGRVGKVLANRLKGIGANVTVAARKAIDYALLDAMGLSFIETKKISEYLQGFDIVFNTVDAPVLDNCADCLKRLPVIDLSTRGCVSPEIAKNAEIIKLPALPGKTAPKTAGKILSEVILRLI